MLRKTFLIVAMVALMGLCLTGCKKSSDDSGSTAVSPPPPEVKTAAEYGSEAEKEITKENMASELDKLEKEIETDIRANP